jgi:hypothetical protein
MLSRAGPAFALTAILIIGNFSVTAGPGWFGVASIPGRGGPVGDRPVLDRTVLAWALVVWAASPAAPRGTGRAIARRLIERAELTALTRTPSSDSSTPARDREEGPAGRLQLSTSYGGI